MPPSGIDPTFFQSTSGRSFQFISSEKHTPKEIGNNSTYFPAPTCSFPPGRPPSSVSEEKWAFYLPRPNSRLYYIPVVRKISSESIWKLFSEASAQNTTAAGSIPGFPPQISFSHFLKELEDEDGRQRRVSEKMLTWFGSGPELRREKGFLEAELATCHTGSHTPSRCR